MPKKNILIATEGLSPLRHGGGIASYAHDLAENLIDAGHRVTVYLVREVSNGIPQNVKYDYKFFQVGATLLEEEEQVRNIYKDIELLKPDVIINNDTSYISGLWPVFHEEIIKISVMHAFSKSYTYSVIGIIGKMAVINHEYVDYIICQNSLMVRNVARRYNVPIDKLIFIPQAASHIDFALKPKNDVFTIVYAGGQHPRKGAVEMLKIAKYLQNSSLNFKLKWCLFADKYKENFKNDNRFQFLGNLPRAKFFSLLQSSDCIIIPTHMDTGPMLLSEAMGQGVIPICNNLKESAIPDIIEDGENGILIDGNNPEKYFAALKKLLENLSYQEKLKKNVNDFFIANLTKEQQAKNFEILFRKKNSNKKREFFSDYNIIYDHRKRTSHLPHYSLKKIRFRVTNALEMPMYKRK